MVFAFEVQDLEKVYAGTGTGSSFSALGPLSLSVRQGEFFGLLGANGAGKTTLISILVGLVRPSVGSARVMGFDVVSQYRDARRHIGVVPQELSFDPFLTVRQTLQIQSGYYGMGRNDDWIDEMLCHLHLADKADANMRMLSGGMKRRVLIAQALVHKPDVVVLDEPTAGVDVQLRKSLWKFITQLNQQGHTILLTTHYLEEAEALCGRVAMLKKGKVIAIDQTKALLDSAGNSVRVSISLEAGKGLPLQYQPLVQWQDGDDWILKVSGYAELQLIMAELSQQKIELKALKVMQGSLADLFFTVEGECTR